MLGKRGLLTRLSVLILLTSVLVEAQERQIENVSSAQAFSLLIFMFRGGPAESRKFLSPEFLKRNNFTSTTEGSWELEDSEGRLFVADLAERNTFIVTFRPFIRRAIPSAVLSALISKSASIEFWDADTLQLHLPERSLSPDDFRGTYSQVLSVDPADGTYKSIAVEFRWIGAK